MKYRDVRSRELVGLTNDLDKLIVRQVDGILIFGRDVRILDDARWHDYAIKVKKMDI